MSPIRVRVLETGRWFPSFSVAVQMLTGRKPHGRDYERFTLGRPIAGLHFVPEGVDDWTPDPRPCCRECPVRCVETGEHFPSISAAARSLGVAPATIYRAIRHGRICGGYRWTYA